MGELNKSLSETMRKETEKVYKNIGAGGNESNTYYIKMAFASKNYSGDNIQFDREIKTLRIIQDYVNNVTDKITATLQLDLESYLALYYLRKDLFCTLTMIRWQAHDRPPESKSPDFEYKYRCLILDTVDIFKQISSERLNPKDQAQTDRSQVTLTMRVELISEDVYVARKRRINVIARDVKMLDILRYTCNFFGFSNAVISAPDNDLEYTNFVIPPDYGVTDIMSYLQNGPGMGVYANGFCSYISQGCWYIFPRYGDAICKRAVQIYSVGSTNYVGMPRNNWNEKLEDDTTVHIIINGEVSERNWSSVGTENRINAANIQCDDVILNNARTMKSDGKYEVEALIRNEASISTDPMNEDETINLEFRHSVNNLFTIKSELGSYQITTLGFIWENCEPFVFHPGTIVKYNYDHRDGYKTMTGKCEKVEYVFKKDDTKALAFVASGTAQVLLSCNNAISREAGCC